MAKEVVKSGIAMAEEGIAFTNQTVEVTAPSNLPGGFQFSCESQGKRFTVRVPDEGVKQGQVFQAHVVMQTEDEEINTHEIPHGHWRDGLCDCFNHCGSCMVAFCCQPCLLGQVMGRFNLGLCGNELPAGQSQGIFSPFKVLWGYVAFLTTLSCFKGFADGQMQETGVVPDWYVPLVVVLAVLQYAAAPYLIYITYKTYSYMARRYQTAGSVDGGDECSMCLEATFCRPCVTARMIRHSANHDKYPYNMCEERGLAPHAPAII